VGRADTSERCAMMYTKIRSLIGILSESHSKNRPPCSNLDSQVLLPMQKFAELLPLVCVTRLI
jgi:hypothetical protein